MPTPSVTHTGIWHLSKTRPHAQRAADGTFAVVLLVMDRQGPHQVEPWRVTYSGEAAHAWWQAEGSSLQPGDTLRLALTHMRIHTTTDGHALDTFQIVAPTLGTPYRELMQLVENGLAQALASDAPLHEPGRKMLSRRVQSFPIAPQVSLRPDEKAQRWVLYITATDRAGLLYQVAGCWRAMA